MSQDLRVSAKPVYDDDRSRLDVALGEDAVDRANERRRAAHMCASVGTMTETRTRMHADPRYGVVDQNGRVHGTVNLFVAGSSVFPTSGYANPTLTIVALSLRMADHIRSMLAPARPRSSAAHN